MTQKFIEAVGVMAILMDQNGDYLLVTNPPEDTKKRKSEGADLKLMQLILQGMWCFPGGGVKKDEEPKDALKRELLEEVGVDKLENIQIESLSEQFVIYQHRNGESYIFHVYGYVVVLTEQQVADCIIYVTAQQRRVWRTGRVNLEALALQPDTNVRLRNSTKELIKTFLSGKQ